MKLLLTDSGIKNSSIHDALVDLLGKPIAESSALCIPTAQHARRGGARQAWRVISGQEPRAPLCGLGWKSLGVLELTALPSIDEQIWVPMVQETDVLLVDGGDPLYLCYWMRQSGLADLFPSLRETVYVGVSAGSIRAPTSDDGSRGVFTTFTESVDAACAELTDRGVTLLNGSADRSWGIRDACFADPSGQIWEIAGS
jgi:catechol 2,3-dioxygenase-like lactoylglutathione lyase family enzyme